MSKALAIMFAAAPFVCGVIRAATTGSDYRMLAMAIVSFIGVLAVRMIKRETSPSTAAIFFISTVLAAIVAYAMGARAPFGIWAVAMVFGFCYAASNIMQTRARKPV